jgi:hypothetical protein
MKQLTLKIVKKKRWGGLLKLKKIVKKKKGGVR